MRAAECLIGPAVVLTLVLAMTACSDPVAGPRQATPQSLLFLSTRDGALDELDRPLREIYRMRDDGSTPINLTHAPAFWYHFTLSPDREELAFTGADCSISSMRTDGTGLRVLVPGTTGHGCNASPRWSPDGARIAFTSNRDGRREEGYGGLPDVYVMNADGSDPLNVSNSNSEVLGHEVRVVGWSPDGQIVFETNGRGAESLQRNTYAVNPDGTAMRLLFEPGDHSPAWSPDGTSVVFIRDRDGQHRLFMADASGAVRALTNHSGDDRLSTGCCGLTSSKADISPWSPDGEWIAFSRFDAPPDWGAIYLIRADGSGLRRLTDFPGKFNGWSPDGTRIAFTGWQSTAADIFLINADGTDLTNLTNDPSDDTDAIWVAR